MRIFSMATKCRRAFPGGLHGRSADLRLRVADGSGGKAVRMCAVLGVVPAASDYVAALLQVQHLSNQGRSECSEVLVLPDHFSKKHSPLLMCTNAEVPLTLPVPSACLRRRGDWVNRTRDSHCPSTHDPQHHQGPDRQLPQGSPDV